MRRREPTLGVDPGGKPDPMGRPSRYEVASADDLFISRVQGSTISDSWATPNSALNGYASRSDYQPEPAAGELANPQYPTVAGRFLDAMTDRVLRLRMLGGAPLRFVLDSPNPIVEPEWQNTGEPGGAIPAWSLPVPTGRNDNPFALAAGDLDRRIGPDENYHDEAVVAFMDADHRLDVRVVDYNSTPDHLAVTQASNPLPQIGAAQGDTWFPGSLNLGVGDFDGDGSNEVAAVWQDRAGFHATFLRYSNANGRRSLDVVVPDLPLPTPDPPGDAPPSGHYDPSLISGYADTAVGDFTGGGRDEIALGYAANNDGFVWPLLAAFGFDNTFKLRASGVRRIGSEFPLGALVFPSGGTRTSRGIQIAAGLFRNDPANGFTISRRQIAYAWPGMLGNSSPTTVQVLDVVPPKPGPGPPCTVCSLTISPQTTAVTVAGPTGQVNQPISLAAGGFWGLGAPNRIPIWALAVGTSGTFQSAVTFVRVGDGQLVPIFTSDAADPSTQYVVTAYDRTGRSLMLGAPVSFTVQSLQTPTVIAQEPPKHADWLDGGFINVSRKPDYNIRVGSQTEKTYEAKTTTSSSHAIGGSQQVKLSATVKEGLFGLEEAGLKTELAEKVEGSYEEKQADYNQTSTSLAHGVESTSSDDDLVGGYFQTFYIYRYPILGHKLKDANGNLIPGPNCPQTGCNAFYEIQLPGAVTSVPPTPGRSLDFYQPLHENGNALSYPPLVDAAVPTPDLGPYHYTNEKGEDVAVSEALLNHPTMLGGAETTESLDFSQSKGSGFSRDTTRTLKESVDLTVGLNLKWNLGVAKGNVGETTTFGFRNTNSWATQTEGSTDTKSATSFALNVPQITSSYGYQIGTAYYYTLDGTTKIAQAVDLTASAEARDQWRTWYAKRPDPGLNLPRDIVMDKGETGVLDEPKWNPLGLNRQYIRGFFILHPDDPNAPAVSGAPYTTNPLAGDQVVFAVRVYNFSLGEAAVNVPATFYAVPLDTRGLNVTGPPVAIGNTTIPRIEPQGMVTAKMPWTARLPAGAMSQRYRIFVVLNPGNNPPEIHPWKSSDVKPCPAKSVLGGKPLVDPMTDQPETLSCGQNNQGFGTVTVMAKSQLQGQRGRPRLRLHRSSLRIQRSDGRFSSGRRGKAVVERDMPVHLLIHVKANRATDEHRPVLIYDGRPARGRLIASTTLLGADDDGGAYARFSWTPRRARRHTLHAVLLGARRGERNRDKLRVVVKRALPRSRTSAR